jgi:tetratricopeptide (TPR) repeat protein
MTRKLPTAKKASTNNFTLSLKYIYLILTIWAIILYGKTLSFDYALDDDLFIRNHRSVQKGISGLPEIFSEGSLTGNNNQHQGQQPYRPITLASFAIEQSISPENAGLGHFTNLILYILVGVAFIRLLKALFPNLSNWFLLASVLIYLSHPVHVEAVANIKSRDELLAALFGFLALGYLFTNPPVKFLSLKTILPAILFFIALLSKESSITFYPLMIAALVILKKQSLLASLKQTLPVLFILAFYLLLRQWIVGYNDFTAEQANIIHNTLFAPLSTSEYWGTKMIFILEYLRLLLIPYPLSWDYSFNQLPITPIYSLKPIFSLSVHLILIISALVFIRKRPVFAFLCAFYFITFAVTNNVFFVIGATVSERLLFVPSFAFCTGLCFIIDSFLQKGKRRSELQILFVSMIPILIYSIIVRQYTPAWKDSASLFESGVISSPNSARANLALATVYRVTAEENTDPVTKKAFYQKALTYYQKGVQIFDRDPGIFNYIGICYAQLNDTSNAIRAYRNVLSRRTKDPFALRELAFLFAESQKPDSSIRYATKLAEIEPNLIDAFQLLTGSYYTKGQYDSAYVYASRAYSIDTTNPSAIRNMAGVLQKLGRMQEAQFFIEKMK